MSFKSNLYNIKSELDNMIGRNHCMERCVTERLNNSLNSYLKRITLVCDYLMTRSNRKVIRNIANEQKKENNKQNE